MPSGEIRAWFSDKGFGFISPSDGGEDLFCHVSNLTGGEGSVKEGDYVRYGVDYDRKKGKDRAVEVEVAFDDRDRSHSLDPPREEGEKAPSKTAEAPRSGGSGGRRSGGGSGSKGTPGTGKMLRWQSDKGFGFIQPKDGGEDLFCHVSALLDGDGSVKDGDTVTYIKEFNDRKDKWQAVDVRTSSRGEGDDRDRRGGDRRDDRRDKDDGRHKEDRHREDRHREGRHREERGRDDKDRRREDHGKEEKSKEDKSKEDKRKEEKSKEEKRSRDRSRDRSRRR